MHGVKILKFNKNHRWLVYIIAVLTCTANRIFHKYSMITITGSVDRICKTDYFTNIQIVMLCIY